MAIEIVTISTNGPATSMNVGWLLAIPSTATMTFKLLRDSDPGAAPSDVATIHLSDADPSTAVGFFLTPGAPTLTITCNPDNLWVSVHADDHFVQVIAVY